MAAVGLGGAVRHMVQLKLASKADKAIVAERLGSMKGTITDVPFLSFEVVVDLGVAESNSDVGVIVDFPNKEAYLKYAGHPEHLAVVAKNKPLVLSRSAMQWTIPAKM